MRQKIKTKFKIIVCALIAVFGLSFTHSIGAFADTDTPTRTYTIYTYVEGHGTVVAPDSVEDGANLHIEVMPDEGHEVRYAQIDGYYFDDEIVDNAFDMIITGDEDTYYYNIYVGFWPVYEVTEGDGSEYIAGSGEDLPFKIDADLDDFEGTGILGVDDVWLAVDDEWAVNPESNSILLKSDFLATLGLGEHLVEFIFSEPEMGVARARFTVVEAEVTEEEEDEAEDILVPNTGAFTGDAGGAQAMDGLATIVTMAVVAGVLVKGRNARK